MGERTVQTNRWSGVQLITKAGLRLLLRLPTVKKQLLSLTRDIPTEETMPFGYCEGCGKMVQADHEATGGYGHATLISCGPVR